MLSIPARLFLQLACRVKKGGVIINEHTLTPAQMRLHVTVLRRCFDFIRLEDLPRRLAQPGRRPFCLLTFDDGKRSHATQAAPELERLGIPAVFYVTTEALSSGRSLWFDRQKALVRTLGSCPAGLEVETLKRLPFDVLSELLDRACAQYGVADMESDHVRPMSWDDARRLSQQGFSIGAHGCTHAILTRQSKDAACAEIAQSLAAVSSELGSPCRSFAFPNGNYTTDLAQYALECGAATVMTTDPTWADRASSLGRLPRVQLFGEASPARIQLKIALAALRGVLANPDGTGRAYVRPICGHPVSA
jgi:peptidoglycan/xylan/chitin deacetylase (PgdA/CDA1 family)